MPLYNLFYREINPASSLIGSRIYHLLVVSICERMELMTIITTLIGENRVLLKVDIFDRTSLSRFVVAGYDYPIRTP